MQPCPLCLNHHTHFYFKDKHRSYCQCERCDLVFVPAAQRLAPEAEKAHYDHHENHPDDPGYRRFLSRLSEPLLQRLVPNSSGLDFGCGPGPALAHMLREAGHDVALYDIYYYRNEAVLTDCYDFVTASEVIEHLYNPQMVWQQWLKLLKPGGCLAIMTKQVTSAEGFALWHYKLDPTHVLFFSAATFRYLAKRDNLAIDFIGDDVVLFTLAKD